jgi:hypothetical protein
MEYRKLSTLKKLEGNPRIIRDKQFQSLVVSIKQNPKFFEARPLILSNRTGKLVIIAGNQRYEAAKAVGLKEAPTFLMKGLTEEKEREITIRDNTQQGEWDWDLLSGWDDLPLIDWGVDIPKHWGEAGSVPPTVDDIGFSEGKKLSGKFTFFEDSKEILKEKMKQLEGEIDGFRFYF